MRKVKVAAAFLCLFAAGISGGVTYTGSGMSVAYTDQSNQIVEMTADAVTTAASIETTAIVTTAATASESPNRAARTTTETETSVTTAETTTDETETTATSAETTVLQTETMTAPETAYTETAVTSTALTTRATTAAQWNAATEAPQTEQQTVTEPVTEDQGYAIEVTEREYIMLCNVVGHEYGAAWVPTEEKALIVEVIMNRVASSQFPDTIYDVLMQPGQFTGIEYLIEMETLSDYYVTQSVKDAVDLYLTHPEEFDHGYLFFSGDGYRSYFRTSY